MNFAWWKRRQADEDDLQEEIRAHLAIAAGERMADGADAKSARLDSLKEFGNVALTTEAARQVWTPWWLDALHDQISDVRYAIRGLARNPGFSATVIGVLALGIGLNAAVFTMLKGLVLSPLAGVDGSARLAIILAETGTGRQLRVSYPDYQYIRDHDAAFSELLGSSLITTSLGRGRGARQVSGELVTGNYFQVLGVRAARGRTLLPSDEIAPGRHPVIVLSDGLWRRDFGADPDIVGKTVEIGNYPLTVVGVTDATFHGTIVSYDVEVFIPVMMAGQILKDFGSAEISASNLLSDRRAAVLFPHGYLRNGTSIASAAAQTDAVWTALAGERPLGDARQRLRVLPFRQSPTGGQTFALPTVEVLSAMGLLVLLIACANIAGLVLVRGMSRRGEIAVRLALGATRARVVRLLMFENLVLAVPGALLGVELARRGTPVLLGYFERFAAPQRLFFNMQVDGMVIGFAALIGGGSALAFGFVPALRSARLDLASVMNEDASPRGAGRGQLRAGLVVAQVAVSLLLLVGAGLTTRSLEATRNVNPGFDGSHVTAVAVDLKQNGYDEARGRVFYRRLLDAARAEPGFDAVTLAQYNPMAFLDTPSRKVAVEGYEPRRDEDLAFMSNTIGPDYFKTLRINLMSGRAFEDRDDQGAAPVAIVNDTMAQRFWGGAAKAIGKRIRAGDSSWRTIIGVAADVKYARVNEPRRPYVYLPLFQFYRASMILHARGAAPVDRLVDQARAQVAALDADLPIMSARSLTEQTGAAMIFLNFMAMVLFWIGTAGMVLSALGTYGLVSYTVKQSTHEIGIRMALGASGLSVVSGFLVRGLKLGAIGAGLGTVAALAASRLLSGILYGVGAADAESFARALAIVLGGVIAATIVPAWRASRTDPLTALRHQ